LTGCRSCCLSDKSIYISIADICVGLRVTDANAREEIRNRYNNFLVRKTDARDARPAVDIWVEVCESVQFLPPEKGPWVVKTFLRGSQLSIISYTESGAVDLSKRSGRLIVARQCKIENFLRALYSHLCIVGEALMFHASGVIKDGRGFIFCGRSGSGKTTIARLSTGYNVLSDDILIVKRAGSAYQLCGAPFHSDLPELPLCYRDDRAELCAIFLPRKDTANFIRLVGRAEAVAELVSNVPFCTGSKETSERIADLCADLAARVPVFKLHFRPEKEFWRAIDEAIEKVSPTSLTGGGASN